MRFRVWFQYQSGRPDPHDGLTLRVVLLGKYEGPVTTDGPLLTGNETVELHPARIMWGPPPSRVGK